MATSLLSPSHLKTPIHNLLHASSPTSDILLHLPTLRNSSFVPSGHVVDCHRLGMFLREYPFSPICYLRRIVRFQRCDKFDEFSRLAPLRQLLDVGFTSPVFSISRGTAVLSGLVQSVAVRSAGFYTVVSNHSRG